jgi:heme exporter protein D
MELWNYGHYNWVSFKVWNMKMLDQQSLWRHRRIPVQGKRDKRKEEISAG